MGAQAGFGPPAQPDRFAVEDAGERARLLRRVLDEAARVVLHLRDDGHGEIVSRLRALDPAADRIELELADDAPLPDAVRDAGRAHARATLDGVALHFELESLRPAGDGDARRLLAAMPRQLARVQRREAFRVAPPLSALPRLFLTRAGVELEARILDVSATGLAFEWPTPDDAPAPGALVAACRLELPGMVPIRCALRVRSKESRDDAPARLGGEFETLDPPAARAVQVYVNLAQTRGRRARPRIG